MKKFKLQRRLAAEILGIGRNRIWFDPLRLSDIQQALTRSDILELVDDNAIKEKYSDKTPEKFSKEKTKSKTKHKRKGRGTASIRKKIKVRKRDYIIRIRKIRKYLKGMRDKNKMSREEYHSLRKEARSGKFTDLRRLIEQINSAKAEKEK